MSIDEIGCISADMYREFYEDMVKEMHRSEVRWTQKVWEIPLQNFENKEI